MNQNTSKLLKRFINNSNGQMNDAERRNLLRKTKRQYIALPKNEKEEFKKRIK